MLTPTEVTTAIEALAVITDPKKKLKKMIVISKSLEKLGLFLEAIPHQQAVVVQTHVVYGERDLHFLEQKHGLASLYLKSGQSQNAQPELEDLLTLVSDIYGSNHKVR
jgi:hypothetical protein